MTLRADSFSSTSEVKAFTRHLLNSNSTGYTTFNSTTRPSLTEVEKFIDRVSGVLNVALWTGGFNPSSIRSNSTARLPCDDLVTAKAVAYVELTQRGEGFGNEEQNRYGAFMGLSAKTANAFVDQNALGWKRMGVTVANAASEGLAFTALDAQDQRSDPDDTSLEQPLFSRKQFDSHGAPGSLAGEGDDQN